MPSLTEDITIVSANTRTLGFIPLENHMLYSLSIFHPDDAVVPNQCWAEIGLMIGGTTYSNKVALLSTGYIGRGAPLGWTGQIIVLPETYAYAQILSPATGTYRLCAILYKLISLPDGGFRVDP